jgi:hypothetical protein
MADIVTLGDVSTKDTGSGSQLKTGGRRKHNMAQKCKMGQTMNKAGKCVSIKSLKMKNMGIDSKSIKSIEGKLGSGSNKRPSLQDVMKRQKKFSEANYG